MTSGMPEVHNPQADWTGSPSRRVYEPEAQKNQVFGVRINYCTQSTQSAKISCSKRPARFSVKLFSSLSNRPDKGAVVENLVFTELLKKASISDELYFWRTKAGAEMDFVFQQNDNAIPIEIKSGSAIPGRYSRSFHSFLNRFSPEFAIYLNKDMFKIDKVGNTKVFCIPTHWFLLFGIEMLGDI